MLILLQLIIFYLFRNVHCSLRVDPLVNSKVGLIKGLKASDGDYSMFLGIPYGKVNETNTFGPSTPYPNFESVFEAFDDATKCAYIEENGTLQGPSIDCLKLNMYVPISATSTNPMPVLVWIYGGNFERGSAGRDLYGPKYLVRHDVIVVTLNHRVGLYGYMCLNIPEVPGNQGLKDQVLALRWIKNNIEAFGGNTNSITIFGESSGRRSVDFHLVSPQENLFNKAILQSGTSLTRDTIYKPDTEAPLKIAKHLGYSTESLYDALNYLSTVEPLVAVKAAAELELVIKPCIEHEFENVEQFITDYTVNKNIPKVKSIPVLIGYNSDEQIARYADKDKSFFEDLNIIYERLRDYFDVDEDKLKAMEESVHSFYLGDEEIGYKTMREIIDFDSVFSYVTSAERSIRMYLENDAPNVFYYVFSYVGGRNFYKQSRNVTIGGASHADELGHLFDMQSIYKDDPILEDE